MQGQKQGFGVRDSGFGGETRSPNPEPRTPNLESRYLCAVTVISMCALADASFVTPTVVRAGRGA